jgi:hypothetical protein
MLIDKTNSIKTEVKAALKNDCMVSTEQHPQSHAGPQ